MNMVIRERMFYRYSPYYKLTYKLFTTYWENVFSTNRLIIKGEPTRYGNMGTCNWNKSKLIKFGENILCVEINASNKIQHFVSFN